MTQTSLPPKASFDNEDASTPSIHDATDLSDDNGGGEEATEFLVEHSPKEQTLWISSCSLAKCSCRTVTKCSRLEHDGQPFLLGESDKLAFLTLLSYLIIIATFILFFVVHDPVNLRCDLEAHTGDSTWEGNNQGLSKSELRTHGLLVFLRGMLGSVMGYLMGFPMKRLADGDGAIVESLKRENRNETASAGTGYHQTMTENSGQVIFDASGEGSHPVLNARNRGDRNISSSTSSPRSDDAVIDIDPMANEGSQAQTLGKAETTLCDICHLQYENGGPVREGALTKDDRIMLSGYTSSMVMLGLGRLLLIAQMAALGIWWE